MSPFAKKLQDLVRDSGQSYRQIANAMEVSPALLARVLGGTRPPTSSFVAACVRVFALDEVASEQLRYLAALSQDKISVRPKGPEEAARIIAFLRELRGHDFLPE